MARPDLHPHSTGRKSERAAAGATTVAVTGASGNLGTSVLSVLAADERVGEVRAIARRVPEGDHPPAVRWTAADVTDDDLRPALEGVDAVIHLAWRIQPSWDVAAMRRTNVLGSQRVFTAAVECGAGAIVHASSIGAYGPGPKDRMVDESWPLGGHPGHPYSEHKAEVEALLDDVERDNPDLRVVRMRPALLFKREAGEELRHYFLPRHLHPRAVLRAGLVDRAPTRFQVVHADDAARAFVAAALGDVRGPFNLGTDDMIGGRPRRRVEDIARPLADLSWRLHAQPVDPGWVTLVFRSPLIDASRARTELGWEPRLTGHQALEDGLAGIRRHPRGGTPALRGL